MAQSKNVLYPDDAIIQALKELKYPQNDVKLRNFLNVSKTSNRKGVIFLAINLSKLMNRQAGLI